MQQTTVPGELRSKVPKENRKPIHERRKRNIRNNKHRREICM